MFGWRQKEKEDSLLRCEQVSRREEERGRAKRRSEPCLYAAHAGMTEP